jgi:hypothetical protein
MDLENCGLTGSEFWVPFFALRATQGKQGSLLKLKALGLRFEAKKREAHNSWFKGSIRKWLRA